MKHIAQKGVFSLPTFSSQIKKQNVGFQGHLVIFYGCKYLKIFFMTKRAGSLILGILKGTHTLAQYLQFADV